MMKISLQRPIPIKGCLKNYQWGKSEGSLVSKLSQEESDNSKYAELWFGAHHSGPSKLEGYSETFLDQLIKSHPQEMLGEKVYSKYGAWLPFLFKFLSVGQPLSIQVHPNQEQAIKLNLALPKLYQDPYPKPEVGIAISDVTLLYGFKDILEIQQLHAPELNIMLQNKVNDILAYKNPENIIRQLCEAITSAPAELIKKATIQLYQRLEQQSDLSEADALILELKTLYPTGDSGLFLIYLMNLVTIPEGQGLYIEPSTLHAYISGDLAECMAASDNVVRAGLTVKEIDLKNLFEISSFKSTQPKLLNNIKSIRPANQSYFAFDLIDSNSNDQNFHTNNSIEMLVCQSGALNLSGLNWNLELLAGQGVVVPATIAEYSVGVDSGADIRAYRVRVP